MKAIKVSPKTKAKLVNIENTLDSLQNEVGGYIQVLYPFDDQVAIICDEEGKLSGKKANRALRDESGDVYDIVCGDFLIVGLSEDDFTDLTPELQEKYFYMFDTVEYFMKVGDLIVIVKSTGEAEYLTM